MFFTQGLRYLRSVLNKLFWFIVFVLFFTLFYLFYFPETNVSGFQFINPYYDFIQQFPIWVYFVFCFTFVSLVCVLIFIALSLYYTISREREAAQKARFYKFFSYFLTNYFLSDYYKNENRHQLLFEKIKPYVKKRTQLNSFFEAHLKIQETLAMDLSGDFNFLINQLHLRDKIEAFIYQRDFDDKILAMKILSYLRINSRNAQIMKHARSKNVTLRTEAYAALIRLMEKDEHLVHFVGEKHKLSMLDINIIVNSVLKNQKINIDYKALLSSANIHKNMLGLILAKYRYSSNTDNVALIKGFVDNPDPAIRLLAWDALLSIVTGNEVADVILDHFDNETEEIKLLILQKSRNITDHLFTEVLGSIIYYQPLLVKIETLRILFENDINLLAKFGDATDAELAMAYKEVSCVFIN